MVARWSEGRRKGDRLWDAGAVLAWVAGLGFGLPCAYAIWYLADRGRVWMFLGLPTYGDGPFEDIGVHTTTALLAAFLLVCVGS